MYKTIDENSLNLLILDINLTPNKFIPVIGPELMIYNINGEWISIYDLIAEKLAIELQLSNFIPFDPKKNSLEDVVNAFYLRGTDFTETTPHCLIKSIIKNNTWGIPEPVKKLASITNFKFFINATYLPFITDALKDIYEGQAIETVSNSIKKECEDFNDFYEKDEKIRVYNLFGSVNDNDNDNFGLTDDDMLFFVHNLISNCPINLKSFIRNKEKQLLLWGCDFSSWLTRLIFYSLRAELPPYNSKSIYFVSTSCSTNKKLEPLWNRLNSNLYRNTETHKIVDLFYEKWIEKNKINNPDVIGDKNVIPKNSVFISYDLNDKQYAVELHSKLKDKKISAWFDKENLENGDYKEKIRFNIMNCSIFVPIISKNSIDNVKKNKTMFTLEWMLAKDVYETRLKGIGQDGFIVPLIIDDTNFKNPDLPEFISKLQTYLIDDEKFYSNLSKSILYYQKLIK